MTGCLDGADLSRPNILTIAASLAPPEASACRECAIAYRNFLPFVPALIIDAAFLASSPLWYEKRQAVWESVYEMEKEEVLIDDIPVMVYRVNKQWCADLAGALDAGGFIPPDCTVIRHFA